MSRGPGRPLAYSVPWGWKPPTVCDTPERCATLVIIRIMTRPADPPFETLPCDACLLVAQHHREDVHRVLRSVDNVWTGPL